MTWWQCIENEVWHINWDYLFFCARIRYWRSKHNRSSQNLYGLNCKLLQRVYALYINPCSVQICVIQLSIVSTGKTLIACKTAMQNFTSILETEGGPEEKRRGRLLATLNVKCAFLQVIVCATLAPQYTSWNIMVGDQFGIYPYLPAGIFYPG